MILTAYKIFNDNMKNPFSLDGRLALITGGGTGLGLGIARAYQQAGAHVVLTGRREEVLQAACQELGGSSAYFVNDIADLGSLPALVQAVEAAHGPIQILANNAGINFKCPMQEMSNEDFVRVIQTNVNGLFALTREVVKAMLPRQQGVIINIASMAAMYGLPKAIGYTSSKSAVLGMTRGLATELGPTGIRVNAISPGFIYSAMTDKALNADPDRKRRALERTPMGRMGEAEDIGWAAVYLASDAAKFVTGANLVVDGGNSIGF
jgi:NAD(P)-dependent dehydrogenase (short-subunit alcohol dehydrogenase family)